MTSSKTDDMDRAKLDEAWKRLQEKLAEEPVQLKWKHWPAETLEVERELHEQKQEIPPSVAAAEHQAGSISHNVENDGKQSADRNADRSRGLAWLRKRRKWAGFAAACAVFAVVVASPAGNEALASILNKFRMQDVTVVQEEDLRSLFNQMSPDGKTREQINKFGTFTQTSGTLQGAYDPEEAAKVLGRKLTIPADFKADEEHKIFVSPSNKLTFTIHVDEVNKAMKRLGAKKLLPDSIDGKPITLELGETVNYNMEDKERKLYYHVSQQAVPVVTVDPSIPVAEALNAVLDFPLLPDYLKNGLRQSSILSGGSVPLPVISSGETEKLSVGGVQVVLTVQGSKDHPYYSATWVKDGQMFTFGGGNRYTDKASALEKIKELIGS